MVRVGIVEDDEAYIAQLKSFLSTYTQETGVLFQTHVFHDGLQLIFDYKPDFDILLMDIEMPRMNGIEAAKKVRETDPSVTIVFVTSMAQYAIEGYSVQAKAYLLTPLNYYGFSMEIQSAVEALERRGKSEVLITSDDSTLKLPAGRITYIETDGHDLVYHTFDGNSYRTRSSMKAADAQLAALSFARSSVSYLVNLAYVSHLTGDTVTVNGTLLPLSRAKRKEFLSELTEYVGGR